MSKERKIIKFGNSSYVITIPNSWLKKNKLEKGDLLQVSTTNNSILLSTKLPEKQNSVELDIENTPLKIFNKELISYYLKNYKFIKIKGKNVLEKLEQIRIFKEKLPSIEIYEIGKDFILLKDLSDPRKLDAHNLIDKIIEIVKILLDEVIEERRHSFISQFDSNVNKLTFLGYKTINYNLENQQKVEENKNAIYYWRIIDSLESIGDITKRIARYMKKGNGQDELNHQLEKIMLQTKEYFEFITAMLNKDVKLQANLKLYLDKKQSLLKEIEQSRENTKNLNTFLVVSQLIKDIIGKLDTITLSIIDIHSK